MNAKAMRKPLIIATPGRIAALQPIAHLEYFDPDSDTA
jgi:hypothetical protein